MYDRKIDERVLQFEPSGALQSASLVMRDVETDSWWSIMTKEAIAGELEGAALPEIALSAKMPWGRWREMHPESLVLSVNGVTHDPVNPYEGYFTSERTYQELAPEDTRLPAKEPVFAFDWNGPVVIPHSAMEGGLYVGDGPDAKVSQAYLYRSPGASVFESTQAFWLRAPVRTVGAAEDGARTAKRLAGDNGTGRIAGIDTFWYNWVLQNPETRILE